MIAYVKSLSILLLLIINNNINASNSDCNEITDNKCTNSNNYHNMVFNARELIKTITLEDYAVPELKDEQYEYDNYYNKLRIYLNSPENKIVFAIKLQDDVSLIHYKVNNKINLNNDETSLLNTLKNIVYSKSTDNDAKLLLCKYVEQRNNNQVINDYASEYESCATFDLAETIKNINLNTNNSEINQLKLDIYKQLQKQVTKSEISNNHEENFATLIPKFITKYDQEYNAVYAYFINEKFK